MKGQILIVLSSVIYFSLYDGIWNKENHGNDKKFNLGFK